MKNIEAFSVVGSSALQPNGLHSDQAVEHIIEFPSQPSSQQEDAVYKKAGLKGIVQNYLFKLMSLPLAQELLHGSAKGTPSQKAKPWQTVLAISGCTVIAAAIVLIGK